MPNDKPNAAAMKAAEEPNHKLDAVQKLWNYAKYKPLDDAAQVGLDFCMILMEYDTATNLSAKEDALRELVEWAEEYIAVDGGIGFFDASRLLAVRDAAPDVIWKAKKAMEL